MTQNKHKKLIQIGLYLPSGFGMSMATLFYDYFETANTLAGREQFKVRFFSHVKNPRSYSGLTLPAEMIIPNHLDVLIIMGTGGSSYEHILENLLSQCDVISDVLLKAKKNGAIICGTCTANFFLAAAGLLKNKPATASWWLIQDFKNRFADVRWDEKKSLIKVGKIVTTGAGFTSLELAKVLLAKFKLNSLERKIHRILLLPEKPIEQHPYVQLTANISHAFSEKMQTVLKNNWLQASPELLARELGMSLRTFIRKFKEQMGLPPGKWIQLKRIEMAKHLLMSQPLTVEQACYQSGYEDPSSFVRLFQREVGLSPKEFRSTFRK